MEVQNNSTREKWVHNLSQRKLTETECSVLSQGLNFAITPKTIPYDDFIVTTELACKNIASQGEKAALRNEVVGILKSAKLPPSNINREEWKAIQSLFKDKSIRILPADKGRITVVMNTEQYEKQMLTMLEDKNTYEVLKKDPTEENKIKLKTALKPLVDEKKIDKATYSHLVPTASITLRIYGTPKIHKTGTPLRPIVDSIGSVTYNLSKALVEIIKPLLASINNTVKTQKAAGKRT